MNDILKKMPTSGGTKCCVDINSAYHFLWDTNVAAVDNSSPRATGDLFDIFDQVWY